MKTSQSETRRQERLAKALRENIARRKAQIRARVQAETQTPDGKSE